MKSSIDKLSALFILVALSISFIFIYSACTSASHKLFWLDEQYVLDRIGQDTYGQMITHGEDGQMSPAPLDYIFLKSMHQLKQPTGALGLPPEIYYRLYTIFFSFISGLLIVLVLSIYIKKQARSPAVYFFQMFLLASALGMYYFHPMNFHYSIETRPYALWNSLYFCVLCTWMLYPQERHLLLLALMTALSGTMISSLFQLFSLAVGFCMVLWFYHEPLSKIFFRALKLFLLPFAVVSFYILCDINGMWGWDKQRCWTLFFHYWIEHPIVPALCIIAIFKTCRYKEYIGHTIAFCGMLILYLLAPVIIYATIKHGIYFTPRQYIYYNLIYPLFLIHLALALPLYLKKQDKIRRFGRWVYLGLAISIVMIFSLQFVFMNDPRYKIIKLNDTMPRDYGPLINIADKGQGTNKAVILPYLKYYRLLSAYLPQLPEAYGLQGYCYYQLGKTTQAIRFYQKAMDMAPNIIWYRLNLALIYLNQGHYDQAIKYLESIENCDLKQNIAFVLSSQVYLPIRSALINQYGQPLPQQIIGGYLEAQKLLVISQLLKSGQASVQDQQHQLPLQLF